MLLKVALVLNKVSRKHFGSNHDWRNCGFDINGAEADGRREPAQFGDAVLDLSHLKTRIQRIIGQAAQLNGIAELYLRSPKGGETTAQAAALDGCQQRSGRNTRRFFRAQRRPFQQEERA
jgi:hypothetical protein